MGIKKYDLFYLTHIFNHIKQKNEKNLFPSFEKIIAWVKVRCFFFLFFLFISNFHQVYTTPSLLIITTFILFFSLSSFILFYFFWEKTSKEIDLRYLEGYSCIFFSPSLIVVLTYFYFYFFCYFILPWESLCHMGHAGNRQSKLLILARTSTVDS